MVVVCASVDGASRFVIIDTKVEDLSYLTEWTGDGNITETDRDVATLHVRVSNIAYHCFHELGIDGSFVLGPSFESSDCGDH